MRFATGAAAALVAVAACFPAFTAAQDKAAAKPRQLSLENKVWKGDFDQILERRMLRVLVPYSRSLYFNDKGRERGVTADLVRDFEKHINRKYAKQLEGRK